MNQHLARRARNSRGASPARTRRNPVRRLRLEGEPLEPRLALAAITMTANDQLLLELINRARANPLAEVARYSGLGDLNAGLPAGTISSAAKPPLAPNQALLTAATDHALDMLSRDYFSHTNPEGQSPTDRAREAGYSAGVGENIAWGGSSAPINQIDHVYARHESLFRSAGHRQNLLSEGYREAGAAIRYGTFTASGNNWYASMVTENFGSRGGDVFITGVAYDDAVTNDDFYTIGEGAANVSITAVRSSDQATFSTTSGPSGGYALQIPSGTYTVTAQGGGIATQIVVANVLINGANRKVDFVVSESTPPPPPPPPPPDPGQPNGVAIVGRENGNWWLAASTGASLTSSLWTTWPTNVSWQDVRTGDVDGDGHDDLVGRANGQWWVTRDTASGVVHELWTTWSNTVRWYDVQLADVNGDGRDDIIGRAANRNWWVARSLGNSFVNERWGAWSDRVTWKDVRAGDFDGDGRADVAGRSSNGDWWIARSTGTQFANQIWGNWSSAVEWTNVSVGDFNGDGRDDLAGRSGATWRVSVSTGSGLVHQSWGSWSTRAQWSDVLVADVDGDGRDDLVGRANNSVWWVARSVGNGFRNESWGSWNRALTWSDVRIVDLNQDGRDDIVGRTGTDWWAALSGGSSFTSRLWGQWPSRDAWADVLVGKFSPSLSPES